ncbi:tetratricopeptide repeat protein [Paenibacillus sp. OV219]|uniref:tetratricopeptide repeat protein n=1 Tax=Paenibacillus sp. OV219 TaxID=1884377 RepID=UPI0008B2F914|nr:hypothetical protein [Paenibacillus sp. OV219]SEN26971.1 Flp pilus assembly protein TadD, contains TPR repeats [Paenibacillus sp. OV219]
MIKHVFATMQEMLQDIIIHYPSANNTQRKQMDEKLATLKQFSDDFIEQWLQFEEKMADSREMQQVAQAQSQSQSQAHAHKNDLAAPPHALGYPKTISQPPAAIKRTVASMKQTPMPPAPLQSASNAAANADAYADGYDEAAIDLCQSMSKGQGYFKLFMFREASTHFEEAVRLAPDDNRARLFLGMTYMHMQEWNEAQRHFTLLVEVTEHPKWRALSLNALGCIQAVRMNLEQATRYFEKAHEADPNFTDPLSNMKSCEQHSGHLSLYFGSGQL